MNRALSILELVESICKAVHKIPGRGAHKTLYSLARVSRFFSDPALDILWMYKWSMTDVLMCMPDDLWEVARSGDSARNVTFLRARREIEPQDWNRFDVYARRIRVLVLTEIPGESDPESCVFDVLAAYPRAVPVTESASVHLFLGPLMEEVMLNVLSTAADLAILPALPSRCPLLTSVTIDTVPDLDPHHRVQSLMICGFRRLTRVGVRGIDQAAFNHLAQLPALEALTIHETTDFEQSSFNSHSSAFAHLQELSVRRARPDLLASLLKIKDIWSLVRFVSLLSSTPTATETARVYTLLVDRLDPATLMELTVNTARRNDPLPLPLVATTALTIDAIRSLFVFRNLREVTLVPPGGLDLDDGALETLARAWPQVSTLKLHGTAPYRAPPSRVTLRGLRALARHCPRLQFLSMPLDASVVPPTDSGDDVMQERLAFFFVDDAVLDDPAPVAVYLFGMFPNLKYLGAASAHPSDDVEVLQRAQILGGLWEEVQELRPHPGSTSDEEVMQSSLRGNTTRLNVEVWRHTLLTGPGVAHHYRSPSRSSSKALEDGLDGIASGILKGVDILP
ncbi:hypothetical protein C8R47DRAFT_1074314 [Mycena vitilis]|nr:hypothetical protein C8R47DRAFT_1074314 [Mycena vitilis]